MPRDHDPVLPRICIVYTGGTMGSKPSDTGLLEPASLEDFVARVGGLRPATWNARLSYSQIDGPLIDSAAAVPADWRRVRDVLEREWDKFDGFVVVHGTDTMPYLASFLSFAIEWQDKPVVVTGSMKPIFENGDASANLKASVHVAASRTQDGKAIDQILICFGGRILRGNRTAKVGNDYNAISTPRVRDLGRYATSGGRWGIPEWTSHLKQVVQANANGITPTRFPDLNLADSRVALIRLFPGITADMVRGVLTGVDGAVVEAYGSGTGPADVRECLLELAADGTVVVVTTEVVWGEVEVGTYATDLVTADSPLVPCRKMLAEAALTKLHYLLGIADRKCPDWQETLSALMQRSIRGENGTF